MGNCATLGNHQIDATCREDDKFNNQNHHTEEGKIDFVLNEKGSIGSNTMILNTGVMRKSNFGSISHRSARDSVYNSNQNIRSDFLSISSRKFHSPISMIDDSNSCCNERGVISYHDKNGRGKSLNECIRPINIEEPRPKSNRLSILSQSPFRYLIHSTESQWKLSSSSHDKAENFRYSASLTSQNYSRESNKFYIAIFDYTAHTDEEIDIHKGEYILKINASWYFRKISRKDSERLLLLQGNCRGTFLIRESETTSGDFALSVRDLDPKSISTNDRVVHYRVKPITNSHQVCITTKQPFANLSDLIDHYSRESDGLACQLTRPCPRPPPPVKDLSRLTRDHWAIERSSIELVSQLGAGQFGEVWKGLWNGTIEVAVKTLKPGSMTRTEFLKEAKIMKQLQHRHLVRLYAVVTDEPIYIVTELMQHGSLLDYLRSPSGQQLTLANLTDMMTQIADGMSVLEEKGLVHRDLATRNILVGGSDEDGLLVKIADFGLARILDIYNEAYTAKEGAKFPIKWTAPEAAAFGRFTVKSDVWSYGVVMFELVTYGQLPFAGMGNCETLEQIDRGYRMPQPLGCPNHLYTIMLQTWDVDPEQRPSFTELAHYFDQLSDAHSSRVGEHMTAPVDIVNRRRSSSSNCDNFKRRLLNRSSMIAAMPVAT